MSRNKDLVFKYNDSVPQNNEKHCLNNDLVSQNSNFACKYNDSVSKNNNQNDDYFQTTS